MQPSSNLYLFSTLSAKALSSLQACRTRSILTIGEAIQIFEIKIQSGAHCRACTVAASFGISEKAVRDIWKGRTWHNETKHLDPLRAGLPDRLKPPGRPRRRPNPKAVFEQPAEQPKLSRWHTLLADNPQFDHQSNFERGLWPEPAFHSRLASWWDVPPLPDSSSPDDPFRDDWQPQQRPEQTQ